MAGEGSSQRARKSEPRYDAHGHLLCHAHSQTSGALCKQKAMENQKVCRYHGGKTPNALMAARRRKLMDEVNEEARRLQVLGPEERFKSPQDAIQGLYRAADRGEWMVEVLTKRIQGLNEMRWRSDSEQIRGELDLFDRIQAKHANTLSSIVKLALNERQLQVDEYIGRMVVKAITGSLRSSGLEGLDLERAQREAHRLLRLEWVEEENRAIEPGAA